MEIKEETLQKGAEMIGHLMETYRSLINAAFMEGGEKFKISSSLTIEAAPGNGDFNLVAEVSFTPAKKIKDTFTQKYSQMQGDLLIEEGSAGQLVRCPLRIEGDLIRASYCNNKCTLRSEVVSHGTEDSEGMPWTYLRSCSTWRDDDLRNSIDLMIENWDLKQIASKWRLAEGIGAEGSNG